MALKLIHDARSALERSKQLAKQAAPENSEVALCEAYYQRALAQQLLLEADLAKHPQWPASVRQSTQERLDAQRERVQALKERLDAARGVEPTPQRTAAADYLRRQMTFYEEMTPDGARLLKSRFLLQTRDQDALFRENPQVDGLILGNERQDDTIRGDSLGTFRERGLNAYAIKLPDGFRDDLLSLSPDQAWLDAGTGLGNAPVQYFKERDGAPAHVIGVDLGELSVFHSGELGSKPFEFHRGDVRSAPIDRQVDIITDVIAALSYDPDLAGVVRRYGELLKPGGRLYVSVFDGDAGLTMIRGKDGQMRSMVQWMSELPSWKLEATREESLERYQAGTAAPGRQQLGLKLVRQEGEFPVPDLQLSGTVPTSMGPPARVYQEV